MTVLGVDVGTTALKMGVYRHEAEGLRLVDQFSQGYAIRTYNDGLHSDVDPALWKGAFTAGCRALSEHMPDVDALALSGTTPGMTAMDRDGEAVYPAILMLDQRSRTQAQRIIDTVGLDTLLEATGNMPVAGGCSLASILWIKDNHPDLYDKAAVFGHSNTYVARWLTGTFAIDPSSASLSALYNTARNDLTWNTDIAAAFGLTEDRLPEVMHSWSSPGRVQDEVARDLGLTKRPWVIIGGNDAVLAAYSMNIQEPGAVINVNGTCEISLVCLPRCIASTQYNVRCHVIPDRWLTLYVMNAEGKAFEWFRELFCRDMSADAFYNEFMPEAVTDWLNRRSGVTYVPYLMGSRYSLEPLKAAFTGLTQETTREEMVASLVRGLCRYQREHLKEISLAVPLREPIHVTGGAVSPALIQAKERWMRPGRYVFQEQSSMKGAALLAQHYLENSG